MSSALYEGEEFMNDDLFDEIGEETVKTEESETADSSKARELLELLSDMKGISPLLEDEDDVESGPDGMDADDYHNKAVELTRRGKLRQAVELCIEGMQKYQSKRIL